MGIFKRSADIVYAFRFLKLLTTPFENTAAFSLGIIDENGNRIKSEKLDTVEKKDAYTMFHRLVFNVKKIMSKVPGGNSKIASYAAALYLIKEHYNLSDNTLIKAHKILDIDLDQINEKTEWFILENNILAPGIYKMKHSKIVNSSAEELVQRYDKIRVEEESAPVGNILGIDIYEAVHLKTGQSIYITPDEILK